jgi:23S rRNA pseudouridine2605 synthase
LFEALGLTVSRLIRTRYGVVAMPPQLKRGQMAELEQGELTRLLQAAGMTSAAENGGREGNASGRPEQSGQGAQNTPRQESDDDDNQPLAAEVEVESDEALDEVDGNRAPPPSPSPREGSGQPHGRPGKRGGQGPPGGRGGHGPPRGRGGHGPRGGNRGGQQGGQDPGRH